MKILLIILSFFFTAQTTGQSIEKITALLKEKDFIPFKSFVDYHPKTNVDINWEILRDIVPGYQEGIVRIVEYPLTGRDTDYSIHNYQIKFLSTENSIFYYVFDKSYGKEIGDNKWESFYTLLDSFNNQSEYHNFQTAFAEGYKTALNEKELFETSIVYGGGCGITGQPTEYQLKLDSLLKNKDIPAIRAWLKSANSEKQLYAIQGLRTLENSGDKLTTEDIRIINLISKKNGMVNTCSGCIFSSGTIKNVIIEIEGLQGDDYTFQKKSTKNKSIVYFGLLSVAVLFSLIFFYLKRRTKKGGVQH